MRNASLHGLQYLFIGFHFVVLGPRQTVQGRCEKNCFPVLRGASNPRLKLRLVTTHSCQYRSSKLCQNYGKCLLRGAVAYECLCAQGWIGPDCTIPEGTNDKYKHANLFQKPACSRSSLSFTAICYSYTFTRRISNLFF